MFELRIAYVTLSALVIYFLLNVKRLIIGKDLEEIFVNISYIFIIPFVVSGLLHFFWVLPLLVFHQNPAQQLGSAYNSTEAVKFFSFAKLEDAIGLLHPNWPENIFGKVEFLKSEFLFLPILAFGSLLFIKKEAKEKKYILFFAILGLLGAFLAKGANEPFGGIYLWLFQNIPGFVMFRDPTKWYTLVAISYSILIPFSIWNIYGILGSKFKAQGSKVQFKIQNYIPGLFLIFTSLCLILLIRPALFGQLTGTFKTVSLPNDYIKLEQFLSPQNNFSRTLWVPTQQRFGFNTNIHPVISAQDFFKTSGYSNVFKNIEKDKTKKLFQESVIKYVIVPYDSQEEIFLKERKYDEKQYEQAIKEIQNIPWLKRIDDFGKIAVFEIFYPRDHFWSPQEYLRVQYQYVNPTKYILNVQNAKKGDILVFSESFDKYWELQSEGFKVQSLKYHNMFNSFVLPKAGNYEVVIYYTPQDWVNLGVVISVTSLIVILVLLGLKL